MIALRLDPKLERPINNTLKNSEITKKDLFGKYSSGLENLSTDRKEIFKDKVRAKKK